MPALTPLSAATRPEQDITSSGEHLHVSDHLLHDIDPGSCLGPLPRDVVRMLRRHSADLPRYLDSQRLRDIAGSHRRWPLLSRCCRAATGERR